MGGRVKDRVRLCKHCQKEFCIDDNGLRKYCSLECRNKLHNGKGGKKYRDSGKGKKTMFKWRLKTIFGITPEIYNTMLLSQNSCCAICCRTEPTGYGWHIDHCHTTQKVRGLLCSKCNQGIGLLEENIETLKKAIKYLENFTN